ncbi:MAG: hypothetical protein JZD41_08595 [Thermoproteus sp.]|nr:hypothetical protein [Thermoproteus sp.]
MIEIGREAAPAVEVRRCSGADICVFPAPSACSIASGPGALRADATLLFNVMHWFVDPLRELACLRKAAPAARFYVGQPVVETMPGFLAINTALGALHVFAKSDVEALLRSAGLRREALLLRSIPFYAAIWS